MKNIPILMAALLLPLTILKAEPQLPAENSYTIRSGGIAKSKISGQKIIVTDEAGNETDYKIYGFCYSVDPSGKKFQETFDRDLNLLKMINANSIRTYRPLATYNSDGSIDYEKTKQMFDRLAEADITISVGFDLNQDLLTGLYKTYLENLGSHPALLSVLLGNEYNYHYIGNAPEWAEEWFTKESWLTNLQEAVKSIKERCDRFVTVVHGEVPTRQEIQEYKACGVDLIMLNMYRGNSFYNLFDQWESNTQSDMPLVISEFGRSSVTADGTDAGSTQKEWLDKLWGEIDGQLCTTGAGGYIFELLDESWKSGANDLTGSEKDFGVFKEDGTGKQAAELLKELWENKTNCNPTGIRSIEKTNDLRIYPNPAVKGEVIHVSTDIPCKTIEIYSLSGSLVQQLQTEGSDTGLRVTLPTGVYIIKAGEQTGKLRIR